MKPGKVHRTHRRRYERIKRALTTGTVAANETPHSDKVAAVYLNGELAKDVMRINVAEGWIDQFIFDEYEPGDAEIPTERFYGRVTFSIL